MESIKKIKRIGTVISILSKYGFDDFISRTKLEKYLPNNLFNRLSVNTSELTFYTRLRLALEELGPAYVKLGQMMSNREDILPAELTVELQKLQDQVPPDIMNIEEKMERELNISCKEYFDYIDPIPLASASISQVYKARLITGEVVVLKIKREHIDQVIAADILIMKDLANILEKRYDAMRRMNLKQIVASFESNMNRELSLLSEFNNIEKFRKNFLGNEGIYVPKTYRDLSNNNVLCMEFVEGAKINDKEKIRSYGMTPKEVNDFGLNNYLTQILEHGYFHADPHPGNVFLLPNKKFCFIDFGSMGTIMPNERDNLEEIMTNFILKDAKRVIRSIKKLAIFYEIEDDNSLERDIYEIFDILDNTTINEINVSVIIEKLKDVMQRNHVMMPEFIYLLFRGIIIVEGIGKQMDPDMNIVTSIKPFALKLSKEKFQPKKILDRNIKNIRTIYENFSSLPDDLSVLFEKLKADKLIMNHKVEGLDEMRITLQNLGNRLVYALIIAAFSIGSSILIMADMPPKIFNIPVLGFIGFLISFVLGITIIISIYKKDR
ncbi:MAG: AarF/ABC1/UbiB kinase family protein [Flavobacterium sp.]|nr:AarF/ABC1/UbiB kinase family protein [Candidatus Neoflavobacterium equi]